MIFLAHQLGHTVSEASGVSTPGYGYNQRQRNLWPPLLSILALLWHNG